MCTLLYLKRQKNIFVFNIFIAVWGIVLYLTQQTTTLLKWTVLGYYALLIFIIGVKAMREKADIIDLVVAFFLLYPLMGCITFSFDGILQEFNKFLPSPMYTEDVYTNKYNLIMMISSMPYLHIISEYSNKYIKKQKKKNFWDLRIRPLAIPQFSISSIAVIFVALVLVFMQYWIYRKTAGVYIAISNIAGASKIFNRLGWAAIIASGAFPAAFYFRQKKNNIFLYILMVLIIAMFWILRVRMYCAMFIIEMLMCAYIEGFRLKRKHIVLMFICLCLLLFASTLRFSNFHYGRFYYDLFTITGEFSLSSCSSYYLINNPFGFQDSLRVRDLFLQILPSGFRPTPALMNFHDYCISKGYNPWPIGGIQFQGQMYFYFGIFFMFGHLIMVKYLLYVRRFLDGGRVNPFVASFPIFCMVFPRMQVWTLKSMIVAGGVFFIISLTGKKIRTASTKQDVCTLQTGERKI